MKFFILFIVSTQSYAEVDESKLRLKVLDLHNKSKIYLLRPVFLYDNEKLEGKPKFEIQNDKIIDYRYSASTDFLFKNYIGYKKKDDGDIPYSVKNFPMKFLKIDCCRLLVEIESAKDLIFRVNNLGEKYYFKLDPNNLGDSLNSMILSPIIKSPQFAKNLIKNDKQLTEIFNKMKACSKKHDIQCMNNLDERFIIGAKEWTVLSNFDSCEKINNDRNLLDELKRNVKNINADWDLIDDFLKLNDKNQTFTYSTNISNDEGISIELLGESSICNEGVSRFSISFSRKKGEQWKYEIDHTLTGG